MFGLRSVVSALSSPWRSTAVGLTPRLFRCAVGASLVLLGLGSAFVVLLDAQPARIAVVLVNAAVQGAAAVACFWTVRRVRGAERCWRVLIGLTAGGAMLASAGTAVILLDGGSPASQASSGYAVLFATYAAALAGLLSLPTHPVEGRGGSVGRPYRGHAITLLDCLLIVGSIVLLEWGTVLGVLVHTGGLNLMQFLLALAHLVASLILAAAVLLIASFRQPRSPAVLALLSGGLLAYALTSNAHVYHVAQGRLDLPPGILIGFLAAWLLIFLAALVPIRPSARLDPPAASPGPRAMWVHAALPYAVLGAAGLLVLAKLVTGDRLDRLETYGMTGLLLLALVRQMLTLAENTRLLATVRERERQLNHQAFHDSLTGLANRALFTRQLQQALGHDVHDTGYVGDAQPLSVLFLDLDEFKQVNDTFGHAAGDELLKISAERLRAGTRLADTVARLGGDEFAVILDGGGGPGSPRGVGERLAAAVQAPCLLAGRPYTPRASLGLATLDPAAAPASPDLLLHQADLAMYAAKQERAGRLVIYQPDMAGPPPT
ncbi:GGDEF domain-containing protein [Pseudofrankia sp. BMG5.37]|uniref:GGDEF domain-containing protein n=1 Tax=Pseudofrankia sp. BMG5.37 TaxID=3050035 RepID=UPI0028946EF3|nr:GGDEF domain-containing protein [Pseudofrankia sp. BMG5.37]MDT3442921.1 GGDEF domain-containing protein [Pseudofrankia sp. BMG5.37]